ncbi:MAG: HD domain-containing protein [Anaerolineales bacterium]|nr:HD domain-containing protein [Anaerolineales bacterium]MCW5856579.1 HD domain-containing protein [Anaerolineales bacterium]
MPTIEQAQAWYPDKDPVHGFDHVLRVLNMAEKLAAAEGADVEIVRAAVLLHDASGAETGGEGRAEHQHLSAEFARQVLEAEGWPAERIAAVQHCIRAHRFRGDEGPQSLEAQVVFDADKLDVIGAFGVARTLAYDVVMGWPFYAPASEQFRQTGEKEPGETHSSYHEYLFKLSKIQDRLHTQTAKNLAAGRQAFLNAYFEQLDAEARNVK